MFQINLTPASVLALVMGVALAQSAYAGAGGPTSSGDGVGITRADGGALLNVIDPLRDGNSANYVFTLFGAPGDTLFVADWNGDGNETFGVARVDNGALLWIRDFSGTGSLDFELFGSEGDIPIVGDWDPAAPGIEIGFARPSVGDGTLEWVLKDNTPGTGFSRTLFGAATDIPVPGNWDGDAGNGDEFGLVRDDAGALLWITEGSGGLSYALFGAAGDPPIQGDYTGDGNTNFGVRPTTGDGNVFILEGTSTEFVQFGAPTDGIFNPGSFGQP